MTARLLALAVLGLLFAACGEDRPAAMLYEPQGAEAALADVVAALRRGDPTAALRALDERARQGPLPDGALHFRALALTDAGRFDEALPAWEQELLRHPGNAQAHLMLADLLLQAARLADARAHLEEARRLDPALPSLSLLLGREALLSDRDEEAQRHFRDALQADPFGLQAAEAARGLSQVAARRRGPGDAEAGAWARRADYLTEVHQHLQAFRDALARDADDADAAYGMAAAFLGLYTQVEPDPRLLDEAEEALQATLRLRADDARALANLGFVRVAQERSEEARELLERAVAIDPDNGEARLNLARLMRGAGESASAIAELRATLDPTRPVAFEGDNQARAHVELAELLEAVAPQEALEHYRLYLALVPHDPAGLRTRIEGLEATLAEAR